MQILVSRTGLVLNPGQVADLVLAWRQVAVLIGSIPRDRPLLDDMAVCFRLPPPAPQAAEPGNEAGARPATLKTAALASLPITPSRPVAPKPGSRKKTTGAVGLPNPKPDLPTKARSPDSAGRRSDSAPKLRR